MHICHGAGAGRAVERMTLSTHTLSLYFGTGSDGAEGTAACHFYCLELELPLPGWLLLSQMVEILLKHFLLV